MQDTPYSKLLRDDVPNGDLTIRGVGEWHDARPNIDSSAKALVGRLMHLQGIMLQRLSVALEACDLTYYEYSVLAALREAGAPWALSPSTLKTVLLFTSGGLSNLLKRLERRRFITRASNPQDGRGVLVHLTPQGKQLVDAAIPRIAAAELQLVHTLSARERNTMARLLCRIGSDTGWHNGL